MSDLLKKLKLKDSFETQIPIEANVFRKKLSSIVDKSDTSIFSNISDIFSSSKNDYRGSVSKDSFKLKRKKKLFDMNMNSAVAEGIFKQEADQLIISTNINAFQGQMKVIYIILPFFYILFLTMFLIGTKESDNMHFVFVPFIIFHACLMMGIPYMMMRTSVGKMKKELEREFYFLTRN